MSAKPLTEAALLRRLTTTLGQLGPSRRQDRHYVGPGDDAAVLGSPGARPQVLCCDQLVEDIDFRLRWASMRDVGHKAAAINLSDLAAMGAAPRALLASVAVPPHVASRDVVALMTALDRCGRQYGAGVIGGDLSRTRGPLVISVTAVGALDAPPMLRHQARAGDLVAVSGPLGAAAEGLRALEAAGAKSRRKLHSSCVRAQLRPRPHVALGHALAQARCVRSAADISDGLVRDVRLLLPRGLGVRLVAARIPLARGVSDVARAVTGGEDFVLVAAIAPSRWAQAKRIAQQLGERLWPIGRVERARVGTEVQFFDAPHLPSTGGFDHFA